MCGLIENRSIIQVVTELPNLQLIRSQQGEPIKLGNIEIVCGAEASRPPFSVDVQVIEEDTWQVLSADNTARVIDEHPIRLMTGLIDQQPLLVGKVQINGSRWQATIVDFDQNPVCQREWIDEVYRQILDLAATNNIEAVSMPLLGVSHGCIVINESLRMLIDLVKQQPETGLLRIWLSVPEEDVNTLNLLLAESIRNN